MAADAKTIDANVLLSQLVDIIGSAGALPTQFERLARDLGVEEGERRIIFLSGVKKILRELPEKAFADKAARLSMVDAVQEALDKAIEAEEAMAGDDEEKTS